MQETSELYKRLLQNGAKKETRLLIGSKDTPITNLTTTYGSLDLRKLSTSMRVFSGEVPSVGDCVSSEIKVVMHYPKIQPPRQGKLVPQVRLTDGTQYSEWISKGVFFIDTRKKTGENAGIKLLTLTGFDAMLRAEQDYPSSTIAWPAKDIDVVREIAKFIGVEIDPRTIEIMTKGYNVQYPGGEYSCRETLGYIAAMYGGCFIMSDIGELRMVQLGGIPKAVRVLGNNSGVPISFGGELIRV